MNKEEINYISAWVINEVYDYLGATLKEFGFKVTELNHYSEKSLSKAIELAIEAYEGGAR